MEFSDWITRKYIDWRGDAYGHNRTVEDFAVWIGISQPLMTQWMKKKGGKVPRSQITIARAGRFVLLYLCLALAALGQKPGMIHIRRLL
jgi:hypothetical protein